MGKSTSFFLFLTFWIALEFQMLYATKECHIVKERFYLMGVGNKDIVPSHQLKGK